VIHISCDILQAPETERAWQRFTRQGSLVQSQYRPPFKSIQLETSTPPVPVINRLVFALLSLGFAFARLALKEAARNSR
jgi:hypothetical protein